MTTTTETQELDLIQVQMAREERMTLKGMERYLSGVSKARSDGREGETTYGMQLMKHRLEKFKVAIDAWKDECATGHAGVRNLAYSHLKDLDSDTIAFLTMKQVLNSISDVRTLQWVGVRIGEAMETEMRLSGIRSTEKADFDSIVKGTKTRSSFRNKRVYANRRADYMGKDWNEWSNTDQLHVGIKLIDLMIASVGIIEVVSQSQLSTKSLKLVKATQETLDWIDEHTEVVSMMRPAYEPMVVQPKDWTNPFDGGYLSSSIRPLRLVKAAKKRYLQELGEVDMPIVYEAVNALQRTAWQINSQVLAVMQTLWNNNSTLAGIPPREGVEAPPKPFDIDTNDVARKQWRIDMSKNHTDNIAIMSKRVGFKIALDIASDYNQYRRIYMPYTVDFRGRIYAVPHLHPQGSDNAKSLLRFANGKPLGEEGWKWLAFHGANCAGNDKVSLEDRVNWVLDNEDEILAIAADPYGNRGWHTEVGGQEIDSPWQFLAFCFEWAGYCEVGEEFVSKLPVALDGSCSGIQHFSAMLRDEVGGNAVNLIPKDLPADVYKLVAEQVIEQVTDDLTEGTEDELRHDKNNQPYVKEGTKALAKQWLDFGINRKVTKRSVMTLAYGSKEYGFKEQLLEDIIIPAKKSGKEFPFSVDGFQAAGYLAKHIWVAVNRVLVKAGEAMHWLQDTASLAASEGLPVRWTTAVGFPVMQAYESHTEHRVKTVLGGALIYLTMRKPIEHALDKRKQTQGIAPNFVHSCDASHMMLTTVRAKQAGIRNFAMIHDSFGTTAADVEKLFRIVRESFVEMYETVDVLGDFRDEILVQLDDKAKDKMKPLPESGNLSLSDVINSRYCFA